MKIILIRHGQTENNFNDIIQGRGINEPLNDTGIRQAKKVKEKINKYKIDKAYTSPMARAWQTAIITVGDKVEIKEDKRLVERYLGNFEGLNKSFYDHKKYWDYNLNSNEDGVEPIKDIINRVKEFYDELLKNNNDETVVIITHKCIINVLHNLIKNIDFTNYEEVKTDNCCILEYEVK